MVSVVVKTGAQEREVVLAPRTILEKHAFSVKVGDPISATCAPSGDYFKGRTVTVARKDLQILNAQGFPVDAPDGGRKSTVHQYDVSREIHVLGTIREVHRTPIGEGYVTNILVVDGAGSKEIFLGPDFIFGQEPPRLAKGDSVELYCSPEKNGYRARQLRTRDRLLVILDAEGHPLSQQGGPRPAPVSAGDGSSR